MSLNSQVKFSTFFNCKNVNCRILQSFCNFYKADFTWALLLSTMQLFSAWYSIFKARVGSVKSYSALKKFSIFNFSHYCAEICLTKGDNLLLCEYCFKIRYVLRNILQGGSRYKNINLVVGCPGVVHLGGLL